MKIGQQATTDLIAHVAQKIDVPIFNALNLIEDPAERFQFMIAVSAYTMGLAAGLGKQVPGAPKLSDVDMARSVAAGIIQEFERNFNRAQS